MTLPRAYAPPMIDLGTLAGLLKHDHQLAAYCLRCDRWSVLPLAEHIAQGKIDPPDGPRALPGLR